MAKKPIILDEYIKTKAGVTKKEQVEHGLMDSEENFVDEEKDFVSWRTKASKVTRARSEGRGVSDWCFGGV